MNITINQITNQQETVQNTVLSKILAAKRNNGTINLTGNIYISAAFANEVQEFCTYFGLTEDENSPGTYRGNNIILSIGTSYISFQDNEVARIVNGTFGTDGHTTVQQAKNAVFTSSTFKNNTVIQTFPEFDLFTKANNNPPGELFYGCTNLIEINLNNVSIISNNEFQETGITEINAPSLSSLGAQAFNSSKVKRIISLGNITSIPDRCFGYCTGLETVILPSSVTSIEQGGFMNNESLTTINLNNITSIGNSVFNSCNLLNINVSNLSNIITLGGGVFERCYNIYGELNLPKLVSAGNNCFDSCGSITKVKCIGKLTSIPERFIPRVANGTSSLTEVYLPYECISLGVNAFHRCGNLTTIKQYTQSVDDWIEGETPAFGTLSKITTFSEQCFVDCTSLQLTSNDIQGAITIGDYAFKGVTISGTLNCPNLTQIGKGAFQNCGQLTAVSNLGTITALPDDAISGSNIISIVLPTTIRTFGTNCFSRTRCSQLIFPYGVTNTCSDTLISHDLGSSIRYCQFPSTLQTFYMDNLFMDSGNNINCVFVIQATTPPNIPDYSSDNSFGYGRPNLANWYVPDSVLQTYKTATGWDQFSDKIYPISQLEIDYPAYWTVYQNNKDYGVPV